MKNYNVPENIIAKARLWLANEYDEATRNKVADMLENDPNELTESFYQDLEFGTGGLRGIMGTGTNRMNIYTVGMATQGLCNYLKKHFGNSGNSIAIAYDSRNNSRLFAETAAKICSGNDFKVYLFESLRPTPELSFAVRELGCRSGIVITASHNPKEYNGFKAYWEDGGQLINPHDRNVIEEVQKIKSISEVLSGGKHENIEILDERFDEIYIEKLKSLSLSCDVIERQKDLKIVYTPIHGTGVYLVPKILREYGFVNIYNIPEQDIVSGDFPTVHSPNPEEKAAMNMALEKAKAVDADLVMATDPDADRVGIGVKDQHGNFVLLNGNQAASLLIDYILKSRHRKGLLKGNEYIVKTIVTSELLVEIAKKYNVEYFDVLTGFKYIAELIRKNEGKKLFIGGGEESYGYLAGEFVRDKDAVMSCALIAEAAAWAKDKGSSLFERLLDIYIEFGFYKEELKSVVRKGKDGAGEIRQMMVNFRANPPKSLGGSDVVIIKDYQLRTEKNLRTGKEKDINLPKSDVLQFITADGSKISVRPSGTEPKIKFYFGVKSELKNKADYEAVNSELEKRIEKIIGELVK